MTTMECRTGDRYFLGHYLRDEEDKVDWRASPLHAPNFKGLAPALVLTAGYDPLADEGLAYAKKLEQSGGLRHRGSHE